MNRRTQKIIFQSKDIDLMYIWPSFTDYLLDILMTYIYWTHVEFIVTMANGSSQRRLATLHRLASPTLEYPLPLNIQAS